MSQGQKKRKGFRQKSPPVLKYLQGILRKYPDGGQILKELIQNADDARAEEVILLYDARSFGTQSLFSEGLASTQGPALLAYNNGLFSEADWEGIQSPGISHKEDDPSTVGRFGLGFNSVYHITDFPSILSDECLGVLDPQQIALLDGGQLWDVSEWEEASDQFQPFWAALKSLDQPCPTAAGHFQGTLFRFPLRQSPSKISENLYGPERVQKLLLSFLNDAPISLLFLRNIKKLTLGLIGSDGAICELLKVEATTHQFSGLGMSKGVLEAAECHLGGSENGNFVDDAVGTKLDTATHIKTLALCGTGIGQASKCNWLVLSAEAKKDAFPELWDLAVKVSSKPMLSLAYCLQDKCTGRLSCVLPLPATEENTTGLPLHISAPFQLTDDRRHVQWSEEGSQASGADGRWNHLLMEEMLPVAYCQMVRLASACPDNPYGAWPDPDQSQQLRYKPLVAQICQSLMDMKLLVRVGDGEPRLLHPREAVILPEVVSGKPVGLALEKVLLLAGSLLAAAPLHVRRALVWGAKGKAVVQEATTKFVRETLRWAPNVWRGISLMEKQLLLEYLVGDGCYQELRDLPLLPTANGNFTCFGDSGETVFLENCNFPRILLPGLGHQFLPKDLNPQLLKHLETIAEKGLFRNLVCLNLNVIEQSFRGSLPKDWVSSNSAPVSWCPKKYPDQPPLEWLAAFWSFLSRHAPSLAPFRGCPLIPLTPLHNSHSGIQLARLLPQPTLLFQSHEGHCLSGEVAGILERLGCTVIWSWQPEWCHHQLREYILEPTPGSVLQAFAHLGVASVAGRVASLSTCQIESLSAFFSTAASLSPKEAEVLTELPLFFKMPSLLPPTTSGLVLAKQHLALEKNLVPPVPSDLLTPEPLLLCRNEAERRLLLLIRKKLLGTPDLCLLCIKAMKKGAYANRAQEAKRLMLWVLHNGDSLFSQSQELQTLCRELPFLDCGSGELGRPSDLYDPENHTLQDLLRPCRFPAGPFREPAALRTLRALGLKSDLSAVCPADVLMAAEEVSQLQEAADASAKSRALILVCNETPLLSRFSSQELKRLRSLPWVPATNISTLAAAGHFLAPESLRSERYTALVGLVMGLTNAFWPKAAEKLGLEHSPPPEKVMENLAALAQGCHPGETMELTAKLHSIYRHMQQHLRDFQKLPVGPVVWNGTGFSLAADVVLAYPDGLDLTALMSRVPPDFQGYSQLFAAWGVRKLPQEQEVCQAIQKLADQINARPQGGIHAELLLMIAVLDWLCARGYHGEREMPVPVQIQGLAGFALRPASSVLYCDMDRAHLAQLDGDPPTLVHQLVSSATAAFHGVEMLSTRFSGLELFEAQAWGPSEPITLRIRNVLREYNQDADVFLELLQNAEDAGAQTCRFLVDLRENNGTTEGLLDPGMAACQGPALWAQNDAFFSETDFSNIICLGAATKERQDDKIGCFGLGFCTVYHITDVPSLLSGNTMLIFDPNITHLGKHIRDSGRPGTRFNLTRKVAAAFPEQFQSFRGIFGCQPGDDYQGTLLRLPFRTEQEAEDSQICCDPFGPSRIKSLLIGFREMYKYLLIFLGKVQEVSLTHLPRGSSSPEATQLLATVRRRTLVRMGTSAIVQLTATWKLTSVVTSHYLLHSCSAQGEALQVFKQGKEEGVHFSPPVATVALPLRPATTAGKWVPEVDGFKGRAFCFLPLPIETGLPLHLTTAFAVQSNRKGLWETTEKGKWNRALLRDSVLGAWLGALSLLRDMYKEGLLEDYEYHAFWPDVRSAKHPFSETVKAFYQALVNGVDGEQPVLFSDGQRWCPAQDACILNSDITCEEHLEPIAFRVFSLLLPEPKIAVSVPDWVKMNFRDCIQGDVLLPNTYNWARFLCELALPNLAQLAVPDRDALILCALDMNNVGVNKILTSLPCIPTVPNNQLKNIKELVHPRGCVAPLYASGDGRFPMGAGFLEPERLLRLERLGMAKDCVEMEELIARARTVAALWYHDSVKACQRARCILELLEDHLQKSYSNTTQVTFRDIPFLPAVLPANQRKLCCPREVYYHKLHPLVGLTEPVLDKAALGKGLKLSTELKEFLGLNRQPPISTVLRQLEEASCGSNALSRTDLGKMAQICYDFLNEILQKNALCKAEVSQRARTFPFVFIGTGFVSVCSVAHCLKFDAAPYLFQLPQEYQKQKQLWEYVGLPETFKVNDYATVLQTLAKKAAGQSLSKGQLALVVRLITVGLAEVLPEGQQLGPYEAQSVFFPDKHKVLHPLPKLLFDDTPWLPHENGTLICHAMIPREIAMRCGIQTTKGRVLSRQQIQGLSPWATDFGAKEEICTRLANILRDYSSSQDVLKELLQNADDAGANLIHFVWDRRQHPTDRVFSKEWNELQGPALCVYNDRTFQMCDIEGIQRLGSGGKGGRRDATGKYGLGFNTVYHLTDCPAFVTGDSALCVFDPTLRYLPGSDEISPGAMYSLAKEVRDTLSDVYNSFLPDVFNLEQGTVFRLPLRTPAGAASSRICQSSVSEKDMVKIMVALKEEADSLVLFLNHVRCVIFSIINENGGTPKEVLRVEAKGGEPERLEYQKHLQQAATAGGMDEGEPIRVFYRMKVNSSNSNAPSNWLVGRQIGLESDNAVRGMHLACGGVAACLDEWTPGRAFCTLPLPEETGLPIHISGNFAVDSARRGLRMDDGEGGANMSWNNLLLKCLVAPLYCHLLYELRRALSDTPLQFHSLMACQKRLDSNYLQYFPFVTKDVPPAWQQLVTRVYELAYTEQLPLVPVCQKKINFIRTQKREVVSVHWIAPRLGHPTSDPYFLQSEISESLELTLQNLGMNLVPAFQHLQEVRDHFVKAGVDILTLNSPSLCCFLKNLPDFCLPCPLPQTPVKNSFQCSALLKFCLCELLPEDTSYLEGLPLLVTQDQMLRCFTQQCPPYHSSVRNLFPHHQDCFSASLIDGKARQLLVKMGFLKDFTLSDSVAYIKEMLSLDYRASSDEGRNWLRELWTFFENQICTTENTDTMNKMFAELLSLFKGCAVLPTCRGCTKFLAPLESLNTIMPGRAGGVSEILVKLGFAQLDSPLLPPKLTAHCILPNVLQIENPTVVLEQLAARHDLCWDDLNEWDFETLLRFLSSQLKTLENDHGLLCKLKSLPVFKTHQGKRVSLASYRNIYLLESKIPKEAKNFQELYEVDEKAVLLSDSLLNRFLSKSLSIGVMNDLQQFVQQLLPKLPHLLEARVLEAVKLLLLIKTYYLKEYQAVKKTVVTTFQSFAFIRDRQGVMHPVSYFYEENMCFQKLKMDYRFVPRKFYESVWPENIREVKEFLLDVGLRKEISEEDFLVLATEIAKEALRARALKGSAHDLDKRRMELWNYLLSSETFSDAFLEKVSNVRFLLPRKIPENLCCLHSPYVPCYAPVAPRGSLLTCKVDLAWTSAVILPLGAYVGGNKETILTQLGVLCTLPAHLVLENLRKVCQAKCDTAKARKTREDVLKSAYGYLSQQEKLETGCLKGFPVVLVDGDEVAEAQNVVISLKCPEDFRPYLYKLPPKLAVFMDVLEKLGVEDEASIHHYASVLARIHAETVGRAKLHPNLTKTVLRATQSLFQLLGESKDQMDFSELKELHLPCTDGKLYPSNTLVFSFYKSGQEPQGLQGKFRFLIDLSICSLPYDKYKQQRLLNQLPEALRPINMWNIIEEQLEESSLKLCTYGEHCEFQNWLQELLVSCEFQDALVALLKRQDGTKEEEVEWMFEELYSLERLEVVCCEKVCTIMVHDSQSVEGTQYARTVYVAKMPDDKWRIYLAHQESMDAKWAVEFSGNLATGLNTLLGQRFHPFAMKVLGCILVCQRPAEIAEVLEKNQVPLHHPENLHAYMLPSPGEDVPEEWYDSLDMSILHNFLPGDYVGYLDSSKPREHYLYAVVLEALGPRQSGTGQVHTYLVDLGGQRAEVSSYDLYHFQRNNSAPDLSKAVVLAEGSPGASSTARPLTSGNWCQRPLNEVKKEVDACLAEIWSLSEDERRKALRRLYLCYHPDKNIGQEDSASEIFKYLKEKIKEMEDNRTPSGSRGEPKSRGSYKRNSEFWDEWDQQAHQHQQRRTEFTSQRWGSGGGGGHCNYNFWSFHQRGPKYSKNQSKLHCLEEARRWLKQAKCDLKAAASNAGQGSTEWLLYKTYRAVEKALTAAEYHHGGRFDKNLTLPMLASKVASYGQELEKLPDQIEELRQHGVDDKRTQYPSYHNSPIIPNEAFLRCKEKEVLLLAEEILSTVKKWTGLE